MRRSVPAPRVLLLAACLLAGIAAPAQAPAGQQAEAPASAAAQAPDAEAPGAAELQAAWSRFLARLEAAGPRILALDRGDAGTAAEGYQYLAMLAGMAIEREQAYADPVRPVLARSLDTYKKLGLDAADNTYRMARFEPGGAYVVRGVRGNSRYLGFQVNRGEAAVAGTSDAQMRFEADGSFALFLGGPPRPHNWLALPEGADGLYVREIFIDWARERGSSVWIERLDRREPPPRPDAAAIAAQLERAADRVERDIAQWEGFVARLRAGRLNRFEAPAATTGQGGSPDNLYAGAYFRLGPGEALVVETDPVEARLWNVQLGNTWFQSLDYQYRQGSLNSAQVRPGPDGRLRIVVAHSDPGHANWLDTGGRAEGVIYYRWNGARTTPGAPRARVVPFAELAGALPPGSPRLTPEERAAELAARYAAVARRFAL